MVLAVVRRQVLLLLESSSACGQHCNQYQSDLSNHANTARWGLANFACTLKSAFLCANKGFFRLFAWRACYRLLLPIACKELSSEDVARTPCQVQFHANPKRESNKWFLFGGFELHFSGTKECTTVRLLKSNNNDLQEVQACSWDWIRS